MIDGINSSEEGSPNEQVTVNPDNKIIDLKEIGANADSIVASFQLAPEFSERMTTELKLAKRIVEGIKSGEISDDLAAKIIAVGKTELAMATETDSLTELSNRPAIERIMKEQVALAKRNGTSLSIAFMDLDKFKDINDRFTHDAGDSVLQGVGGYLKSELKRPTDKAGRWGGEEFIIVLPDTDEEGASQLLNDLSQGMNSSVSEASFQTGGYEFDRQITASIGVISAVIDKKDSRKAEEIVKELVSIADKRVLLAKENGRNRVVGTFQEKELMHQA
jgi:diguanylate cyclase (GGDEF)-like protein